MSLVIVACRIKIGAEVVGRDECGAKHGATMVRVHSLKNEQRDAHFSGEVCALFNGETTVHSMPDVSSAAELVRRLASAEHLAFDRGTHRVELYHAGFREWVTLRSLKHTE